MKNMKVSELAKENFDSLKDRFDFPSSSECIIAVYNFFKNNNVSPREILSNNYSSLLFDMKKEIKEEFADLKKYMQSDSQSLRKRHGAIERDYFISFSRKLNDIHDVVIEKNNDSIISKIEDNIYNDNNKYESERNNEIDTKVDDASINFQKTLENKNKTIKEYEEIIAKQDIDFKKYSKALNQIKNNISFEKSSFGKSKVIITLEEDEVHNIFNSVYK